MSEQIPQKRPRGRPKKQTQPVSAAAETPQEAVETIPEPEPPHQTEPLGEPEEIQEQLALQPEPEPIKEEEPMPEAEPGQQKETTGPLEGYKLLQLCIVAGRIFIDYALIKVYQITHSRRLETYLDKRMEVYDRL